MRARVCVCVCVCACVRVCVCVWKAGVHSGGRDGVGCVRACGFPSQFIVSDGVYSGIVCTEEKASLGHWGV